MSGNSDLSKLTDKIDASHKDFNENIRMIREDIVELKTLFKGFSTKQQNHEDRINCLEETSTEVVSSFEGAKYTLGIASVVILGLIGTITAITVYAYQNDIKSVDAKITDHVNTSNDSISQILQILQKNPKVLEDDSKVDNIANLLISDYELK